MCSSDLVSTIAMILKTVLPPTMDFEVMASDISLKSLLVGKQGFYPESRIVGIPPDYLQRFFTKADGGYQVKDELKSKIKFDYHNLKHNSRLRNLNVVFCRNVLIYFDEAAQLTVINRFWDSMAAKSFLFIGHSESLFGMDTKFEFLKTDWACFVPKKYLNCECVMDNMDNIDVLIVDDSTLMRNLVSRMLESASSITVYTKTH